MNKISKGDQGSPYTKEEKRAKKREELDEDFSRIKEEAKRISKDANSALNDKYEGQEYDPESIAHAKQWARDLNKASLKDDLELPEGVVESGKISQEDFDKARKNAIKKKLSKYDY